MKVVLSVSGMTCSACSNSLESRLKASYGVNDALVNLVMGTASIDYDESISIDDLNKYISDAGFKSLGEYKIDSNKEKSEKRSLIINGIIALLVLYISMGHMIKLPVIPFLNMMDYPINYSICLFIFTIYFLIIDRNIIISGIKNIKYKSPNMDTLVTIGVLSSFIYSSFNMIQIILGNSDYVEYLYFESACIVLYLVKLGRYIDSISREHTKDAIASLVKVTPEYALTLDGDKISIDQVKLGDILLCNAGDKFAVDGVIVEGFAHVDESFINGESIALKRVVNDKVLAGSINLNGTIKYKAEKIGYNSTISEIVRLVVNATNTKTKVERITDKVSGIFVIAIIIIAIITFISYLLLGYGINESLLHFISCLVISCPCALGLASPLAVVVSMGVCASNGLLVKKSEIFELVNKIDTVVFDKTGTLTYGSLDVSDIFNYSKYSDDELIDIVSSIEKLSNHPISSAFNSNKYKVSDFKNIDGLGIFGIVNNNKYYLGNSKLVDSLKISNKYKSDEDKLSMLGNSIIYIIENNNIIGIVGVSDKVREEASFVINKLKSMNKHVIMLSGDNKNTAELYGKKLGIDDIIANVLPNEKKDIIKSLSNDNNVMMVGDGINDAPSLMEASIGISLSSSTDIAYNSANVILINDNLLGILNLIDISKHTLNNIYENLFWAFFYNVLMIPAAIGLIPNISINPMIAGASMMLSSFTVILNALRLKRWRMKK
jgi:Cu+-exporting ATPase